MLASSSKPSVSQIIIARKPTDDIILHMRVEPEKLVAAKLLFESDRTCCVCRTQGKQIQIHHIDEDHANSIEENLAVLCFECHDQTMIKGGFGRKLDATQVLLYKADWVKAVGRARLEKATRATEQRDRQISKIGAFIDELEDLKKKEAYDEIIFKLDEIENITLRDEFIEKYVAENPDDMEGQIFFRSMQKRVDLLDMVRVDEHIDELKRDGYLSQVARALFDVGRHEEAITYYLDSIKDDLQNGNTFGAAFYLKELSERELHARLFEKAHRESHASGDRWWEMRSLQELELFDEVDALLDEEGVESEEELLEKYPVNPKILSDSDPESSA
jgi:tetratricopeptide (TPR) repeat protein